jgi:glycosyltransferase involved in cell wall biosynthesis
MLNEQKNGFGSRRVYYWVHHTGRYDGNTGVQRVVRALAVALADMPGVGLVPVRWCSEREAIVRAEVAWTNGLSRYGGPMLAEPAEAGVPLHLTCADAQHLCNAWLIIAEVTHFESGASDAPSVPLPVALDYARYYGIHTAVVFYDLVPLRERGYESLISAHASYVVALGAADLILPISRAAATDLEAWWREQGHCLDRLPPVRPVLLAAEMVGVPRVTEPGSPAPQALEGPAEVRSSVRFLAVGTIEPRKNQMALMQAVNRLRHRRPELDIQLDLVGALHHTVARAAQQEAERSAGSIRLHQYAPEVVLRTLLRECDATVFISLAEGFGLPIVESLWHGKPCLCSNIGSMAEIAADGG